MATKRVKNPVKAITFVDENGKFLLRLDNVEIINKFTILKMIYQEATKANTRITFDKEKLNYLYLVFRLEKQIPGGDVTNRICNLSYYISYDSLINIFYYLGLYEAVDSEYYYWSQYLDNFSFTEINISNFNWVNQLDLTGIYRISSEILQNFTSLKTLVVGSCRSDIVFPDTITDLTITQPHLLPDLTDKPWVDRDRWSYRYDYDSKPFTKGILYCHLPVNLQHLKSRAILNLYKIPNTLNNIIFEELSMDNVLDENLFGIERGVIRDDLKITFSQENKTISNLKRKYMNSGWLYEIVDC